MLHTAMSSQGPQKIKLLINRPSLGFEDVEDQGEPAVAQVIEIPEDVIKEGKYIPLRFVRFQAVNSLHVSDYNDDSRQDLSPSIPDICGIKSWRRRGNPHRCDRCVWRSSGVSHVLCYIIMRLN